MTSLPKTTGVARLAALALGAVLAVSGQHALAAGITSSGVTGGCATGIVDPDPDGDGVFDVGVIDVLAGGSWDASFDSSDTAGSCFFNLKNTSNSAFAATTIAFTVDQGNDFGFENFSGNVSVGLFSPEVANNPFNAILLLGKGSGQSGSTGPFNIPREGEVTFDVVWGTPFGFSQGTPRIAFSVTATAVPLPAAGWLMIAGLGGLAALRRRKRAA